MIAAHRELANAILSSVNGGHFPVGGPPQLFTESVLEFLRGQWQ